MDVIDRIFSVRDKTPSSIAINTEEREVSYHEFCYIINRISFLISQYSGKRIAIFSSKSINSYASIFSCLQIGAPYSFISPQSTNYKASRIVEIFRPSLILVDEDTISRVPDLGSVADVICLEDVGEGEISLAFRTTEIAYVAFTSGTSGNPKGVIISREALNHYVSWAGAALALKPGCRISQYPELSFDLSICDTFGALCHGATLFPFAGELQRLRPARKISADRITHWNSVPSAINLIAAADELTPELMQSIKTYHFCGEPLKKVILDKIFECSPDAKVINAYGPTEATVAVTSLCLNKNNYASLCRETAPLGAPIHGMDLILESRDDGLKEILISGPQLSSGYLEDPDLTDAKFHEIDRDGIPTRVYRSGDLITERDGCIYFEKRSDNQVKINGYRIELDEIASAFSHLGWPFVAIGMVEGRVCALIETTDDVETIDVQNRLSERLEKWAIPSRIKIVPLLPQNLNGKPVFDGSLFADTRKNQ